MLEHTDPYASYGGKDPDRGYTFYARFNAKKLTEKAETPKKIRDTQRF